MTTNPDSPRPTPGQLDLDGATLDAELAELAAAADDLARRRTEHQTRALDRIVAAAEAYAGAGYRLDNAVAEARAAGATWEQIGRAAGITRQSAWQRWATPAEKL
jgi:hypothetical protein